MSRTRRSPIYRSERNNSCYREPRHAQAFRASKDEHGIRYGAIPKKVRTGKRVSSSKSDWILKNTYQCVCRETVIKENDETQ